MVSIYLSKLQVRDPLPNVLRLTGTIQRCPAAQPDRIRRPQARLGSLSARAPGIDGFHHGPQAHSQAPCRRECYSPGVMNDI